MERFRTAAAEMRNVSGEISREFEVTRQELRRASTDLPREATEQASAMRRVVAEQVRALSELNEIVSRSGRAFDVAEAPTPARRPEPARLAEPAPRAVEAPRQPAFRAPELTRSPDSFREEPRRPALRPATASASADRGPGWLSDLLARASKDEDPALPFPAERSASQSLDSISLDIARMIDHESVADVWDRYNRGDRSAFSRRLYTPKGQQTFDEIRRRYRGDTEFRDTVDRYTNEFERLVSEVSREDRDGSLVRTYLTSDTGKVYTMLAHASGRFD